MLERVHAALDLMFQILLASVGLMYSKEEDCKLPVVNYLMASGVVFALFAALRLSGVDPTVCQFQVNNLQPFLTLGFVLWGRSATWAQLSQWTVTDVSSPDYCRLLPMAAGVVALVVQMVFFFYALLSMVGVLVVAFLFWVIAYTFITGSVLPHFFQGVVPNP